MHEGRILSAISGLACPPDLQNVPVHYTAYHGVELEAKRHAMEGKENQGYITLDSE